MFPRRSRDRRASSQGREGLAPINNEHGPGDAARGLRQECLALNSDESADWRSEREAGKAGKRRRVSSEVEACGAEAVCGLEGPVRYCSKATMTTATAARTQAMRVVRHAGVLGVGSRCVQELALSRCLVVVMHCRAVHPGRAVHWAHGCHRTAKRVCNR